MMETSVPMQMLVMARVLVPARQSSVRMMQEPVERCEAVMEPILVTQSFRVRVHLATTKTFAPTQMPVMGLGLVWGHRLSVRMTRRFVVQ